MSEIEKAVRPFDGVRRALHDISHKLPTPQLTQTTHLDYDRRRRTGAPEIVYAASKEIEEVVSSLAKLADATGRAMASRCPASTIEAVRERLSATYDVIAHREAKAIVVAKPGTEPPVNGGRVGIITAGSSDGPIAAEAALVAREMGATVSEFRDIGVAGLHRLVGPLEELVADEVDAIVVVAGMDGALPSVVAGLVPIPVIGLPTSTGYGFGGDGTAALMAMLQSCAPGLAVVNIDNGVGAGITAALIANRVGAARTSP